MLHGVVRIRTSSDVWIKALGKTLRSSFFRTSEKKRTSQVRSQKKNFTHAPSNGRLLFDMKFSEADYHLAESASLGGKKCLEWRNKKKQEWNHEKGGEMVDEKTTKCAGEGSRRVELPKWREKKRKAAKMEGSRFNKKLPPSLLPRKSNEKRLVSHLSDLVRQKSWLLARWSPPSPNKREKLVERSHIYLFIKPAAIKEYMLFL